VTESDRREEPEALERLEIDAGRLMREHPPRLDHPHKRLVFEIACPPGSEHHGLIRYSRWGPISVPDPVRAALAALADCLEVRGRTGKTVDHGTPAPVLVVGVERRCRLGTDPDPDAGRPRGLYGGAFALAAPDVVRRATQRIEVPTITHVIAMAAPNGGVGTYVGTEIAFILRTAHTAFLAARNESSRVHPNAPVVIHTGWWGCGVFGGNRVLMAALQIVAAGTAGIDVLAFHTGTPPGSVALERGVGIARKIAPAQAARSLGDVIARFEGLGLGWGVGDGN
jgi:poly(ADP-ribose)glycohydrolase PARG